MTEVVLSICVSGGVALFCSGVKEVCLRTLKNQKKQKNF